jgi:hypothetical protein
MKPTDQQLKTIRGYGSAVLPEVNSEELEIVPFIASDNFVSRSKRKWTIQALDSITRLLPGLSYQLDHDWDEVDTVRGLVFEAKRLQLDSVPYEILAAAGNEDLNRTVFSSEGYSPVIAHVAFPATSQLLSGLQLGAIGRVSIGGFMATDVCCPECDTSFRNPKCPHYPPSRWWPDDPDTTDYAIWQDTTDLCELSLVTIPDVPGAQTILNKYKDLYGY